MPEADTTDDIAPKLGLSPVQVAASALAAVSAAVFASWFGTAGTLIGAALGSIVATVGAATYSYSLRRTAEIARRTATQVREGGANLRASLPRPGGERADDTRVLPVTTAAGTTSTGTTSAGTGDPSGADDVAAPPWWTRFDPRGKGLPWVKIGLASLAVMAIAMVAITTFEGATGRSVANYTGGDNGRTTVGNLFDGGSTDEDEAPEETPTDDPSDDATQAPDDPTDDPSQAPSGQPSVSPSPSPTPSPTTAPPAPPTQPTGTPAPTAPTGGDAAPATPSPASSPSS